MNYTLYPGRKNNIRDFEVNQFIPLISIITPFFNSDKYIEETANSVLNQTFPFFEWIIIDDGSENSESLIKLEQIQKRDKRIKVFHKENSGPSETRDFGAKKSSKESKYLFFLDADDLINKTYLECAYWTLETNKNASWAYTDTVNFEEEEYTWKKWFNPDIERRENLLVLTSLVRKDDFFKVNGFEIKEKNVYEDWYLWLKMLNMGMYPVRMSYLGFWYRHKPVHESELKRSQLNNKVAMKYIDKANKELSARNNIKIKSPIQYPKQDYNWEEIVENVDSIIIPNTKKNNKINILLIIPWMVVGGADKFNLDLISKLDKEKFDFTIITTEPSINQWRQNFEEYATIYDLTTFLDRKYWIAFINYIIKSNNINLIFNTNSTFGYASLPYIKVTHPEIPIIDYVHMEEWYNRNGGFSRDSSTISSVIDMTFLCNKNSEKILINHFHRNEDEIDTVYIGVDEKKFNPRNFNKNSILKKYGINMDCDKFIVSFIARIDYQKRPILLMNIIKNFYILRKDVIFVIAGDGPVLDEIKDMAKKISDSIIFLGNVQKTEDIYAISDITLNCSIKEGLALTAYESLAMGVPVVSSDVGGQVELINDEVGIVVPCLQKEEDIHNFNYLEEEIMNYVKALDKILNNLEYYKNNARKRIINGFTIDNMICNMTKILTNIVENPNKDKIENARKLENNKDITKELITKYFICAKEEYRWLCEKFNNEYIGYGYADNWLNSGDNNQNKNIREILIKVTKKLHIYNILRKVLRRGDN